MRELTIIVFIGLFMPQSVSAALYEGVERGVCFKKEKNINIAYECLSKKNAELSRSLDELIYEMSRRIKANNDGPVFGSDDPNVTIGDVYSKYFLESQTDWKKYRKNLCLGVASEIGKDTYDYQSYIDQCEINLNKRHMEEINLMDFPPAK
ncbi:MAG: lysozyme inhibitor LprI family protein [Gibbsiella quercinecans]|uniref:lysozyme inhibitor LprI family protein n=1 Tax=Gibbsiella quercinecans TaxID=929813 RepID=UPI003F30A224